MIEDCPNYYHKFVMLGDDCGSRHMIFNEIHVLELPKLPKDSDGSKRYDWLTFIDWEKEDAIEMIVEKDENIKEAYVTLKHLSLDEEKQYLFEAREKAQRDERACEKLIRSEGREEGKIEVAKKLVASGLGIELIVATTGLPESLVRQLQEEVRR